jgi:hypothetical protein
MTTIFIAILSGLLTYAFLYGSEQLGAWMEHLVPEVTPKFRGARTPLGKVRGMAFDMRRVGRLTINLDAIPPSCR